MKYWLASLLAFSLVLSGCKSNGENTDTPIPALSRGQELFLTHCVACHQGPGNPPGPQPAILESSRLNTEDSFRELLRHPTSAMMRSFSESDLNNADVAELYRYLSPLRTSNVPD